MATDEPTCKLKMPVIFNHLDDWWWSHLQSQDASHIQPLGWLLMNPLANSRCQSHLTTWMAADEPTYKLKMPVIFNNLDACWWILLEPQGTSHIQSFWWLLMPWLLTLLSFVGVEIMCDNNTQTHRNSIWSTIARYHWCPAISWLLIYLQSRSFDNHCDNTAPLSPKTNSQIPGRHLTVKWRLTGIGIPC